MENGVPIKAFMGEKNDEELLYMVTFLEEIYGFEDVRTHIKETFKLTELMEEHSKNLKAKKKLKTSKEEKK